MKHAVVEGRLGVFLVLLWSLWITAIAMGEKVPQADGLGWDGVRFAKMTQGGPSVVLNREINRYYVQRVGPSFAVRGLLATVGASLDDSSVRRGFLFLNATVLSLSLALLLDAAIRLGVGAPGRWLLFLGLFTNLANGRLPVYYAPLGDSTAFFIGSLMVWAYVTRRTAVLVSALAVAIVSWPAAFALLPLLIFPRREDRSSNVRSEGTESESESSSAAWYLIAFPLGVALLGALWLGVDLPLPDAWDAPLAMALGLNAFQLGLAAALSLAVFVGRREKEFGAPSALGVVSALVLISLSVSYVRTFESGSLAFGWQTYGREIILFARARPFAAVVGHAAYFGALSTVAVVLWKHILRAGLSIGSGAFIALSIAGLLSLDAESRRLNASWPLVGLFAAIVLERLMTQRGVFVGFALLSLVISKLWWPLGGPPLLPAAHEPGNYFNTQGPNLSTEAFLAHLTAVALVAAWILAVNRRTKAPFETA